MNTNIKEFETKIKVSKDNLGILKEITPYILNEFINNLTELYIEMVEDILKIPADSIIDYTFNSETQIVTVKTKKAYNILLHEYLTYKEQREIKEEVQKEQNRKKLDDEIELEIGKVNLKAG